MWVNLQSITKIINKKSLRNFSLFKFLENVPLFAIEKGRMMRAIKTNISGDMKAFFKVKSTHCNNRKSLQPSTVMNDKSGGNKLKIRLNTNGIYASIR